MVMDMIKALTIDYVIKKCKCGAEIESDSVWCDECLNKIIFDKADKIRFKDYKLDMIYDWKTGKYFNIDELYEHYEEHKLELPRYVYGYKAVKFKLDMYSFVENELEVKHYDGAFRDIDEASLNELQEIVDKWTDSQKIISYRQDHNMVVLLDDN